MQEIDAGRLQLDDTLARRLPDFAARHAGQITLRDLLRHTSGLANPDDSPPTADGLPGFYSVVPGPPAASLGARSLAWCGGTPKAAPGQGFDYNNCDTLVLAAVLERSSGLAYAELVQQRLAGPLAAKQLRLVTGAESSPVRAFQASGAPPAQPRLAHFGASGALEGTALDLLDFDRGLLSGRWLSAEATRTMWTGEPRLGYVALGAWAFPARLTGCTGPVSLVERRGDVGGIQVRNLIAPALGQIVIVFTNNAELDFGEIWQGRGLMHDLAAAAFCGTTQARS
jgi:CubicO group peptidase (beta-lactamase class C family)